MGLFDIFKKKNTVVNSTPQQKGYPLESTEAKPIHNVTSQKILYEKNDPALVFLFEYDVSVDSNYMEHASTIYFHKSTKKFIYRRRISTISGFSSGQGWGFDEEHEVTYDCVLEILNKKFDNHNLDEELRELLHSEHLEKENLLNRIHKLLNE